VFFSKSSSTSNLSSLQQALQYALDNFRMDSQISINAFADAIKNCYLDKECFNHTYIYTPRLGIYSILDNTEPQENKLYWNVGGYFSAPPPFTQATELNKIEGVNDSAKVLNYEPGFSTNTYLYALRADVQLWLDREINTLTNFTRLEFEAKFSDGERAPDQLYFCQDEPSCSQTAVINCNFRYQTGSNFVSNIQTSTLEGELTPGIWNIIWYDINCTLAAIP